MNWGGVSVVVIVKAEFAARASALCLEEATAKEPVRLSPVLRLTFEQLDRLEVVGTSSRDLHGLPGTGRVVVRGGGQLRGKAD
jgi:hypothetical protein